jgi:hypothetical protein
LVPGGISLLVLLILLIPAIKLARRRVALTRAREPRGRVLVAYTLMAERAADFGMGRRPSETFPEYRSRLKERVRALDGDLDSLTLLAERAAFSEAEVSTEEAREATASARAAVRQLGRAAGTPRRLAGWFRVDPSSLRRWATG